jgi:hypothetical protein
MTATLSLQDARYQTPEKVNQFFDASLSRMRQIPGRRERGRIVDAAVRTRAQPRRALGQREARRGGDPDHEPDVRDAGILRDAAYPGHPWPRVHRADVASAAPVIVVNQAFVARSSPDQDPIGRQIAGAGAARTIVGVVGDIQQKAGWGNFGPVAPVPASYIPAAQTNAAYLKMVHTWFSPSWFVRLRAPRPEIAAEMQRAVEVVDPLLPFAKFRTLDDVRSEAVATQRSQTVLLGALAVLALMLAAVGLYGLVANAVAERTRELGIRLALGASVRQAIVVAAMPGVILAVVGVGIGTLAARLGATTLRHLVWGNFGQRSADVRARRGCRAHRHACGHAGPSRYASRGSIPSRRCGRLDERPGGQACRFARSPPIRKSAK